VAGGTASSRKYHVESGSGISPHATGCASLGVGLGSAGIGDQVPKVIGSSDGVGDGSGLALGAADGEPPHPRINITAASGRAIRAQLIGYLPLAPARA
jgi:hypothetical protein